MLTKVEQGEEKTTFPSRIRKHTRSIIVGHSCLECSYRDVCQLVLDSFVCNSHHFFAKTGAGLSLLFNFFKISSASCLFYQHYPPFIYQFLMLNVRTLNNCMYTAVLDYVQWHHMPRFQAVSQKYNFCCKVVFSNNIFSAMPRTIPKVQSVHLTEKTGVSAQCELHENASCLWIRPLSLSLETLCLQGFCSLMSADLTWSLTSTNTYMVLSISGVDYNI